MTGVVERSWQLEMFRKTLKKQQKVKVLLELLGPLDQEHCLLVTNGDNNGAINYHLRAAGGRWSWAEMEERGIPAMSEFLGEPVSPARPGALPFREASFERVVVIDTHEHLADVAPLNREIARVLAPGGLALVSTPEGNPRLPVAVLKRWVGMRPEVYGHLVQGYGVADLEAMMRSVGLVPESRGAYAKFFTELVELVINFGYVKVLSRRKRGPSVPHGTIAPGSAEQLRAVPRVYRLYSVIYPIVRVFSALDALVPGTGGYAVAVTARKPA